MEIRKHIVDVSDPEFIDLTDKEYLVLHGLWYGDDDEIPPVDDPYWDEKPVEFTITFDSGHSYDYTLEYGEYMDFESSGFDTGFYNDRIRTE